MRIHADPDPKPWVKHIFEKNVNTHEKYQFSGSGSWSESPPDPSVFGLLDLDPDPLARDMFPVPTLESYFFMTRIRIRIQTKMSSIRTTTKYKHSYQLWYYSSWRLARSALWCFLFFATAKVISFTCVGRGRLKSLRCSSVGITPTGTVEDRAN